MKKDKRSLLREVAELAEEKTGRIFSQRLVDQIFDAFAIVMQDRLQEGRIVLVPKVGRFKLRVYGKFRRIDYYPAPSVKANLELT